MHGSGRLTSFQTFVAIAAVAVAATGTGLAVATASGGTTYFGCLDSGKLTKVGTHRPAHCSGGGHVISWNQRGRRGVAGPRGPAGTNGKTILNGTGAPSGSLGTAGDFYLDTEASRLYGPKSNGAWGSGTSLVGPPGSNASGGLHGTIAATQVIGSTPWTAPDGVHSVLVELWGTGGGGGCGGSGAEAGGGGSGGAGGYYRGVVAVTPGQTYTLTLGQPGAGCADKDATAGGDTAMTNDADTVLAAVSGGQPGGNGGDSNDSIGCTPGTNGGAGLGGEYEAGPLGFWRQGPVGLDGQPGVCTPFSEPGFGGAPPTGEGGSVGDPRGFGAGGGGGDGFVAVHGQDGSYGFWTLTW